MSVHLIGCDVCDSLIRVRMETDGRGELVEIPEAHACRARAPSYEERVLEARVRGTCVECGAPVYRKMAIRCMEHHVAAERARTASRRQWRKEYDKRRKQ